MKLGSLFDGIGGFPLSGTYHGLEPVWASEIEPFPIEITKEHFPRMKHLGDITNINGSEIEPVEIITGGSPCQDLSVAGKRAGLEGERSGLFIEQVRVVREMRENDKKKGRTGKSIRPRFMVWENVPGAFSSNGGEDFRIVLEETARISDRGATIPRPRNDKWNTAGAVMGRNFSIAWRVLDAQFWGVPQRRRRIFLVADFAGRSAGEILFESKSLQRNTSEGKEARERTAAGVGTDVKVASGDVAGTVSAKWAKGTGGPAGDECQNLVAVAYGIGNVQAQLYENHGQDSRISGPLDIAPTVSQKYGTGGNNTPLVQTSYPNPAHSLSSKGHMAHREDMDTLIVHGTSQIRFVRRLTPTECERLQGFPDGWTDCGSDTARYKALGNSVAIPCVSWIMGRIVAVLTK